MILPPRRLAAALGRGELSERDKLIDLLVWSVTGLLVNAHAGPWGWSPWDRDSMGLVSSFRALGLYYGWMRGSIARAAGLIGPGLLPRGGA